MQKNVRFSFGAIFDALVRSTSILFTVRDDGGRKKLSAGERNVAREKSQYNNDDVAFSTGINNTLDTPAMK